MKNHILFVCIGLLSIGNLCSASDSQLIEVTRDASRQGTVEISENLGTIRVTGWDKDKIHVTGNLMTGSDKLLITRTGQHTLITVNHLKKRTPEDIKLDVKIPMTSNLTVNGGVANIEVSGITGEQSLASITGNLTTEVDGKDIIIKGGTGKIAINGTHKPTTLTLSTISGDVTIKKIAGQIMATSITGDLDIEDTDLSQGQISTTNGHIYLSGRLKKDGTIKTKTINGDIDIKLAESSNLAIEIDNLNGQNSNCQDTNQRPATAYPKDRFHSYLTGDGSRKISINTINGDVNICPGSKNSPM